MIRKTYSLAVICIVWAATSHANAAVTDLHWENFIDAIVPNSVQNTLFTTMTNDWTNAVVEIDLTEGSLLDPQSAGLGHRFRANGNASDTWIDAPNNAFSDSLSFNVFDVVNGNFDWFDTSNNGAVADGIAARIYATSNAVGTYRVQMFDRDSVGVPTVATGLVRGGAFVQVPEPASVAMFAVGSVAGLMAFRRKKR